MTRRTYQTMDAEMAARGFEIQETGGGCQAYVRVISDSEYEMVTDANDAALPEGFETPVAYGLYVDGDLVNDVTYPSLRALLDSAEHIRK